MVFGAPNGLWPLLDRFAAPIDRLCGFFDRLCGFFDRLCGSLTAFAARPAIVMLSPHYRLTIGLLSAYYRLTIGLRSAFFRPALDPHAPPQMRRGESEYDIGKRSC